MTTTPLTAVACLRTATDKAEAPADLDAQQARCQQLADSIGARLTAVYVDRGVSGRASDRPALSCLLDALERDRVDIVIAAAPDRLARDRALLARLHERIEQTGASLLTDEPGAASDAA